MLQPQHKYLDMKTITKRKKNLCAPIPIAHTVLLNWKILRGSMYHKLHFIGCNFSQQKADYEGTRSTNIYTMNIYIGK